MITYYCPHCWREVPETEKICAHCGVDIPAVLSELDYVDRLIAALSHSEPSVPIRASWILGELQCERAVDALLDVLHGRADPYIKAAAVEALGKIGTPAALAVLHELAEAGPVLLRHQAKKFISMQGDT
jgi:HEAT repeat protein